MNAETSIHKEKVAPRLRQCDQLLAGYCGIRYLGIGVFVYRGMWVRSVVHGWIWPDILNCPLSPQLASPLTGRPLSCAVVEGATEGPDITAHSYNFNMFVQWMTLTHSCLDIKSKSRLELSYFNR